MPRHLRLSRSVARIEQAADLFFVEPEAARQLSLRHARFQDGHVQRGFRGNRSRQGDQRLSSARGRGPRDSKIVRDPGGDGFRKAVGSLSERVDPRFATTNGFREVAEADREPAARVRRSGGRDN